MTERRIVVIAFFAFLAVGSAVILVYAAQPTSHPSIQSGRGAATTRSHRAATSSTTPGTLPQPPTEVEGESATSGTAMPASTTSPATTAPPTAAAPPSAELLTAAPPTIAPPAMAPPTIAPPDDRAADDGAARDRAADDDAADDRAAHDRAAHHRTAHHGSPVDEKGPARASQEVSALGPRNERAFDHRSGPSAGDPDPRTLPRSARSGASARRTFSGGASSGGAALSPMVLLE